MPDKDRWISMKDACDYLGVSRQTVLTWIREKHLPAAKAGKFWRFKQMDLDKWMRDSYHNKGGGTDER